MFDSFAYNQLRLSKPKLGKDQAIAVTGGGKNHPGRGGSRHGSRKPGGSQGGRGNGGSGGRGSSCGGASSGSSSAATAKPGGRTCWVCKSDQHYVRPWLPQTDLPGVWREGPLHNQVRINGERGDGGRHTW